MKRACILVLFILVGCTSEKDVEEQTYTETVSTSIDASALYDAYQANQIAADAKYKDKLIIVTGAVDSIGKDISSTPYVSLKTGEYGAGVQCMFADSHNDALARLSKGDSVSIRGKVSSYLMNVILRGCMLE